MLDLSNSLLTFSDTAIRVSLRAIRWRAQQQLVWTPANEGCLRRPGLQRLMQQPICRRCHWFNPTTSLGSQWLTAAANQHDRLADLPSPVLVSAALIRAAGDERDPAVRQLAMTLASSGFADTSRVGGGNPDLGVAMASSNTDAVLRGLAAYRWSLEQLEEAVLNGNWAQLQQELERTQALRPGFLTKADLSNAG